MFRFRRRRPAARPRRLGLESLADRIVPAVNLSNATINENSFGGALVGTFSIDTPGAAGYTSYQLTAGSGSTDNGLFYVADNQLRERQSLDHETQPTLSIHVTATAANGVTDDGTFTITVADRNERPKNLTLSGTTVPENSAGSTVVGTLAATDPDVGDTLTYTLTSDAGGRFQINGNQVVVGPGAVLNFEQQRSFYIRAKATDSGGLSAYHGFLINVTDVNEAPTAPVLYSNTVAENSPAGTFVGQLAATDPDGPAPALSLIDDAGGRFKLVGSQLQVNGPIDFESTPTLSVTVRATDAGLLYADSTFAINVTNVNEPPANLALDSASLTLPNPAGTLVGNLSATDPDAGAVISYNLTDNAGGKFRINGSRLELADPSLFRWDPRPSYPVTVLAQDQYGAGVTTTFQVSVTVPPAVPTDISLNGSSIPENSPNGQYVGFVSASDPASNVPPVLSLTDSAGGRFQLVGQLLQVANGSLLDYETATSHQVTIRATDPGSGLYIERTFTINVTNVNEAPTDIGLSGTTLTTPPTAGQVIGTLSATDPDGPGGLTFILTDNSSGKFAIANGNQVVVTDPNLFVWDPHPSYNISVMVLDAGGLNYTKTFTIVPG